MKSKFEFYWKKQGLDIHNLPVNLKRNSTTSFKKSGHLMCTSCNEQKQISKLKQNYSCDRCGSKYTIGDVTHRFIKDDDDEVIVYHKDEYSKYMKHESGSDMKVEGEYDKNILTHIMPLIDKDYELYSNDEKTLPVMRIIHEYLITNNKMLLVRLSNSKSALIVPSFDRLATYTLRGRRTIKKPQQLGLTFEEIKDFKSVREIYQASTNKEIDLFQEFVEFKKSGKELEIEKSAKPKLDTFASDLSALMGKQQEKEVAIHEN